MGTKEEDKPQEDKPQWFAACEGISKAGPFHSERAAWESMVLTDKEQERQKRRHPPGTHVWPEWTQRCQCLACGESFATPQMVVSCWQSHKGSVFQRILDGTRTAERLSRQNHWEQVKQLMKLVAFLARTVS